MKKITNALTLAAVLSLASGLTAQAVTTITNPSFEAPVTDGTQNVGPTGYVFFSSGGLADFNGGIEATGSSSLTATDGAQYFTLAGNGSYLYQDLGLLEANTTYTLTFSLGHGNFSGTPAESAVSLLNGNDNTGAVLGSYDTVTNGFVYNSDANGVTPFTDESFNFTTGSSVSGDITFAIQNFSDPEGSNFDRNSFDNVRLVEVGASVPEPSTWALMFGGLALVIGMQKFRRQNFPA